MATPLVAAAAALIHAEYPTLRNAKIIDQITKTGVPIDGPVPVRLDVGAALMSSPDSESSPTPTPTPTPTPPGYLKRPKP
jgi:hypothetical protein